MFRRVEAMTQRERGLLLARQPDAARAGRGRGLVAVAFAATVRHRHRDRRRRRLRARRQCGTEPVTMEGYFETGFPDIIDLTQVFTKQYPT